MPNLFSTSMLTTVLFATLAMPVDSKTFLVQKVDNKDFKADIQAAVGSMLGCGGEVHPETTAAIEKALKPMWQTLPKNEHGRIEKRSLRHMVHRYFMQKSSLMIRGFEPSRPVNQSHWGVADILHQQVPGYVEAHLESTHAEQKGFSVEDAVSLVSMLEQLIHDSDRARLDRVYAEQKKQTHRTISLQGVKQILESYLVHWMVGDDPDFVRMLVRNHTLRGEALPRWSDLAAFAEGQARALDFQRQQAPKERRYPGISSPSQNALSMRFSFNEVLEIVDGITKTFASFWESECASMKEGLLNMDTHATGRVPLSKFYGTALDSEWRFGESEEYLREMGVIDETSTWRGKQVIIPNYIQGSSNCIITTQHYLVCCVNECESLVAEIEAHIAAPTATPTDILAIVRSMTSQTSLDDDQPIRLEGSLTRQLEQVAQSNGGQVPLHGRLFAQWLHYVFPRECVFPHKTGVTTSLTAMEYGDDSLAKKEDMRKHADNATHINAPISLDREELQWMSQWSEEEEHTLDYSMELRAPWDQSYLVLVVATIFLAAIGVWAGVFAVGRKSADSGSYMDFNKAHFV